MRGLLLALLVSPAVLAAQEPNGQRVDLESAVRLFGQNNLELRAAREEAAASSALLRQASAYPNPEVGVSGESLRFEGGGYDEIYYTVSQRLQWPGQQAAARMSARRGADAQAARFEADSARLAFEVKRAYVQAAVGAARLAALRRGTELASGAETRAGQQYRAGEISGFDLRRLQLAYGRQEQARLGAELRARSAGRRLAALILPDGEGDVATTTGFLTEPPPPVSLEAATRRALERRPELVAAEAELEAARASRRVARWSRVPAPVLTGGYKSQSDGFTGGFAEISVPLPLFDRGREARTAASAQVGAAEARLELASRRIEREVRDAYHAYENYQEQWELSSRLAGTGSPDLLQIARVSYREGEIDLAALLETTGAYLDGQLALMELMGDFWISYFELERAIGGIGAMEYGVEER